MALPDSANYPDVRAAIAIDLDSTVLPDSVIALSPYAPAAEAEIARRVANYADVIAGGGDNAALLTRAAILICAALLVPAVPSLLSERSADGQSYTRQPIDAAALVERLWSQANQAIDQVLGESPVTAARPTVFALACGRRGR
ncbi:MAG: hypothetical protein AB7R89_06155 [Dehalococcoidia bacterium]